jgi:pimeloyl-ACP methyl ester carboxylesterase
VADLLGAERSDVRREATHALADLLPSARLVEVESGHFAHLEKPGELASLGV